MDEQKKLKERLEKLKEIKKDIDSKKEIKKEIADLEKEIAIDKNKKFIETKTGKVMFALGKTIRKALQPPTPGQKKVMEEANNKLNELAGDNPFLKPPKKKVKE